MFVYWWWWWWWCVQLWFTKPDYFYNVGADNDRDYDEDGYDDVDDIWML